MKIFKQIIPSGIYKNNTDKYQLLIHFIMGNPVITLIDEIGNAIEQYSNYLFSLESLQYPSISGQENLSTGAITYNAFTVNAQVNNGGYKQSMQKILIPPGYSVNGITSGLFIELDNLDELRGLL